SDESTQLMGSNILAIFANEDGLVDKEKYDTLPIGTNKVLISGNHAGFGDYGIQKDDNKSSISINEQHDQIIKAIEEFFPIG
ncbi:MAG: alpha/beta hydrolase, partial [Mycoplasmatales bacterium]